MTLRGGFHQRVLEGAAIASLLFVGCAHVGQSPTPPPASQEKDALSPAGAVARSLSPGTPPSAAPRVPLPRVLARLNLAAVGDVLPHSPVLNSARAADRRDASGVSQNNDGFDDLLLGVRPALDGVHLAMANLETPVAPKTGKESRPFQFNAPEVLLAGLKATGFSMVSAANNHMYDQGVKGLRETLEVLTRSGLAFAGIAATCEEAYRPLIIEREGVRVAFLAAAQMFNVEPKNPAPCAAKLDEKKLIQSAKEAKAAGADAVVLSVHWGNEYQTAPRKEEIDTAHRLLDGGFDAIIGHHPHVLQPLEIYPAADGRLTFVAYSLGNFLSNQARFYAFGIEPIKNGNPRDGAILRFSIVKKDYGDGQTISELADLSVQPTWTENNARERLRDKKLPPNIRVVVNDERIEAARAELERLDPAAEPRRALELKKAIEFYAARKAAAAAILGEDYLFVPLPPPPLPPGPATDAASPTASESPAR
jgi:poly-gamma-glutamate synthesis protein (capsule biosynthesis protein)